MAVADSKAKRTRVAVVGPSPAGLRRRLNVDGLDVVGAARSVASAAGVVASVEVVVLDVSGRASDPKAQVRALRDLAPEARLVVVSSPMNLRQLRVLLNEGVDAFVLEDEAAECLSAAVRAAAAGMLALPGSLRQTLVKPVLSAREKQVLSLVVLGLTNGEIARKLHLTESTVKSHLSSSFSKLGARSRSEATALILDPATGLGAGILTITGDA